MNLNLSLFLCLFCTGLLGATFLRAQETDRQGFWRDVAESQIPYRETRPIQPISWRTLTLNWESMQSYLLTAPSERPGQTDYALGLPVDLPAPDGRMLACRIWKTEVLAPALAQKYPMIQTWIGQAVEDPRTTVRLDITPKGFHAMLLMPEGSAYIDPVQPGDHNYYQSYWKKEFFAEKDLVEEVLDRGGEPLDNPLPPVESRTPNGRQLRTYRIAIGATGEYSQFHGGTVPDALAAITTTLNRVVGIYERDLAVRLLLVSNNDQVIYLDGATDPYSNNDPGALLTQNQTTLNAVIGQANYDIGHVFSTGGGGLAALGCVCRNDNFIHKAFGVTGIPSPVGDPYDVDYVAHEIGHQFGAAHTFNSIVGSCNGNRSATSAYEPGSGSTIMAYAGLCGSQNLQANSHDYFHTRSYEQMVAFITTGAGAGCATVTNTNNNPPLVGAGWGGYTLPVGTPFEVQGLAVDPDGDSLTYTWEQYDLGPGGDPAFPSGDAPIFRSFPPTPSPHRTFPKVEDLLNNVQSYGEWLPSYSRNLNFRITARDNRPGGGGVNLASLSFTVSDSAGPFVLAYPNGTEILDANSLVRVFWRPEGTQNSPVNCQKVDIYLSLDGGYTWPVLLANDVPNIGNALIQVPDTASTTARIKVKAGDNVFFDISDSNFAIEELNTAIDEVEDRASVSLSPNPAREISYLSVYVEDVQELEVKVLTPAGQHVMARRLQAFPGEELRLSLATESWPAGVYGVWVQGAGWARLIRLAKL